ncbi:hypothetical protein BGX24_000169 [Mortierella sp. AD032]|nr:hypothetical protein BGX24_000169 [Mortierella sp. AD032]
MVKDKKSRQQPESAKDAIHHSNADIYPDPADFTSTNFPASDAASHFSKETTTSDHRKSKSWTKSLKKATNSILYMAMPPTSSDHVPMVVAQTPMSPDRLIPIVHSPILQSTASSIMSIAPTGSSTTMSLTSAPISTVITTTTPFRPMSETAASSTASVTTASITSSVSAGQRSNHNHHLSNNSSHHNIWDTSATTDTSPGQPESSGIVAAFTTPNQHHHHPSQQHSSSTSSSTSTLARTSGKGKERAEPLHSDNFYDGIGTDEVVYDRPERSSLVSPPSSPPNQINNSSDSRTNGHHHSLTTFAMATTTTVESEHAEEEHEPLPSPPPSPVNVLQKQGKSKAQSVSRKEVHDKEVQEIAQGRSISQTTTFSVKSREMKQELLPAIPDNISRFSFAMDAEFESAMPKVETREDIVFVSYEEDPEPLSPVRTAPLPPIPQPPQPQHQPQIQMSVSAPIPRAHSTTNVREAARKELTIDIAPPHTPSISSLPITTPASNTRNQKTRSMVTDSSGFPMIPPRALSLTRSLSKRSNAKPQPVKKAPWLWHQDGIHQQRLESHQILSKEQVFEQYHLDLETEGPNGFFLFKLVKKFKRQDPSLEAISSTLLDSEITASPVSTSPSSPTPTSILDNLDATSVSQKLKRQLLLQKRKKQRGNKSCGDREEEDLNLEALLNMSNNNTSLQNLNSSLQEVIDAVDSLKESQEWTSLLDRPQDYAHQRSRKPVFPDSDGEYTSKDKEPAQIDALEKKKGVYSTGRVDGTNLISKKKHRALQRRSSVTTTAPGAAGTGSKKGGNLPSSGTVDSESGSQEGSSGSNDRRGSEAAANGESQFKKQAISQLHIYSRNGLKFKFDVMQDNELHFVEASKKYTFMDPLAAHRQPTLERSNSSKVALSPLNSPTSAMPPPLPPHHPNGSSNSNGRRTSSATMLSTVSDHSRVAIASGSSPHRSGSTRSKSTVGSSSGGRRVFVTRLGRHTLLTYPEYKVLAKSASGFTLGAKLLFQRSFAVATPSFHGKESSSAQQQQQQQLQQQGNGYDVGTPISPTKNSFSTPTPSSTATNGTGESDYFSLKKKPRAMTGFASKAVAAIKPIVTPYNPAEYKNKSLVVSSNATMVTAVAEESPSSSNGTSTHYTQGGVDIPRSSDPTSYPTSSSPLDSSSSPPTPANLSSSPPPLATPSASSSSNPYSSTIKRQGNQAGLKFQHLFITVHQRLQKLELDNGTSFYGSPLVQWTVIEDPAELRWWRDKIGIQMIGRLEGDELLDGGSTLSSTLGGSKAQPQEGIRSALSSAISVRSSYFSIQSTISDASSTSSMSSSTYRSQVSVERLGYRFLRVSGHMGTMKVTVSEQVEARAVALAVQAEMLRQKRIARLQQQMQQPGRRPSLGDDLSAEQPWVELADTFENSDDDYVDEEDEDNEDGEDTDEEDSEIDGIADEEGRRLRRRRLRLQKKKQQQQKQMQEKMATGGGGSGGGGFYDLYEYDEQTGRTHLKKEVSVDRFSRRKRHDRKAAAMKDKKKQLLIERMTMIVGQAKVFKGDWYMKNVYKFQPSYSVL